MQVTRTAPSVNTIIELTKPATAPPESEKFPAVGPRIDGSPDEWLVSVIDRYIDPENSGQTTSHIDGGSTAITDGHNNSVADGQISSSTDIEYVIAADGLPDSLAGGVIVAAADSVA
jgi:hypothetical protein